MLEENAKAKRVLCIVSSMDRGGVETFLMKIYRALDNRQYQMDFIVSKEGAYDDEILKKEGHLFFVPLRTKHPLKSFNMIRQIVKDNNYQYVLKPCNTSIGYFDALAAKLGGANRIVIRSCNANSEIGIFKKIVCKTFLRAFNKIATVKVAPSTEAGRFTFGANAVEKQEVTILNNGLSTEAYAFNAEARKRKRKELEISENNDDILVGCIGRFTKQKNHEFIIKVFEEIRNRGYNNIHLILIGEGELKQRIQSKVEELGLSEYVQFLGNRSDVSQILSAMDIFVLTSYYEGMPNVVIEAQTSGLPCLISDQITNEVKVTDLVSFLSIDGDVEKWVSFLISATNLDVGVRDVYASEMKKKGYDIFDVKDKFVRIVFGE